MAEDDVCTCIRYLLSLRQTKSNFIAYEFSVRKKVSRSPQPFLALPQRISLPTFMEICKYPGSRFEEVCSRILAFYLNPNAEHGMGNLWMTALWKTLSPEVPMPDYHYLDCATEENAEGKSIDIVIKSDKFVIAIENKTTAGLYNPLEVYKRHIEDKYQEVETKLFTVLSVYPILSNDSIQLMKDNGFQSILYKDLFTQIHHLMGAYIMDYDSRYLTHMLDFMQTLENMSTYNTPQQIEFFRNRKNDIEALIKAYNDYKTECSDEQKRNIALLRHSITQKNEWKLVGIPRLGFGCFFQ